MLSAFLVPIKIGPGFWSRVPGVGPGFYSFPAKGTFLSRKEHFHTKGRFCFKFSHSFAIIPHVLRYKAINEIAISFL